MQSLPKPNLFLVGAMKCGTTSLYEYLRGHPQMFFPRTGARGSSEYFRAKEPHFFAPDRCLPERVAIKSLDNYLALYNDSGTFRYRGDASASYLYSREAPHLIKEFCPEARIVIMLRPPLEMMHSKHRHMLNWIEDIPNFYEAVAASDDRRHGKRIPERCDESTWLDYIEPCRFSPQVERYLGVFGREAVRVILLEDLVSKPEPTWLDLTAFLGVDPSYRPEFRVHNESPRNGALERTISAVYAQPVIKWIAHRLFPRKAARRALSFVRSVDQRAAHDAQRERALLDSCKLDIERLSGVLGRDLSHWMAPDQNA